MRLQRLPLALAFLLAALTSALTIRHATFAPWGTDSAGYAGAARRWAEGRLFNPSPLQLWAPWSFHESALVAAPLSYVTGPHRGTDVNMYPLGFPVILAAADLLDREIGVYLVPPIFAGLLVWFTFQLGRRLAGPWAGVLAAFLVAASPIVIVNAITLMSDVPATALLLVAIEMSLRGSTLSAAAAGSAMALAVMVRPVLAPIALIPGVLALLPEAPPLRAAGRWRYKRAVVFAVLTTFGALIVGSSQRELYGGFFRPGYESFSFYFQRAHVPLNLVAYPKDLANAHTPVLFLGLICSFVLFRPGRAPLAAALCALVVANIALYLPYSPYTGIWFLRFVLPALVALLVLLAGVSVWLAEVAAQQSRWLAPLAVIPAAIVSGGGLWMYPPILAQDEVQRHVAMMGRYLREVLPANAAVITFLQGGAIAYHTGRQVIRFDILDPRQFDDAVDALARRGHRPVLVIDEQSEGPFFKTRFAASRYGALDWPPRAVFAGVTTISYRDCADRTDPRARHRPTDVLR